MDSTFEQLADRYVDEVTAYSPVSATHLGDHRYDDALDDVSVEARQKKVAFCQAMLDELEAIDRADLSRGNQVDAALLAHRLQAEIWHIEVLREWTWNPMTCTHLAGNAVYGLVARDFAPLAERLRCAAARMEQFPRMLAQGRALIDIPRVPRFMPRRPLSKTPAS